MFRFVKPLAVAAVLIAATTIGANAQSFNCAYAKAPDEVLICQSVELGDLDEALASLYFGLRNEAYPWRRAKMESEQGHWLWWRMNCGRDHDCIKQAYRNRILELHNQQASVCIAGPHLASEAFCNVGRGSRY